MSIEDKRREGFEAWYAQSWGHDDKETSLSTFMLDERGQYLYGHVHESFVIWNAALDRVAVELPSVHMFKGFSYHETESVIEAIEAAGLKVKS